ncbi:ABC transporter ATP-binding protein [Radicibacter daui]|uniref:ABC transporter ATP-binding protein n=1 Tax=Radicibacter daui TaxID=3064829 RepID=UPI004046A5C0
MSQNVELDKVVMRFGEFTAVKGISLEIKGGEFFSFLGPSGCGKTTILKLISGFLDPTEGEVRIGGTSMRGIGANKRPTAMIFQNLALFPLMSVADNIAFGLEVRGVGKAERRKRADELLDLIALPGQGDKMPTELSGGQRQRVAIARALAVEPQVLLLDEPLSALDLKLRQHMRAELRDIQKRTGVTFIYITHDQGEALTMSDRVAVMSQGTLQQVATPQELYDEPATAFAAGFVGENNRFAGTISAIDGGFAVVDTPAGALKARNHLGLAAGASAIVCVRPERLRLSGTGSENGFIARLKSRSFEGSFLNLMAEGPSGELMVQVTNDGALPAFDPAGALPLGFHATDAVIVPAEAGHA